MALPGLDRRAYEEQMRAEFERALREVAVFGKYGWRER